MLQYDASTMVCWHFVFAVPSTIYVTQPCDVAPMRLAAHLLLLQLQLRQDVISSLTAATK